MCYNTGGLCEYLCCFLWLIRHFVMDQNRLTEYFGLCVAFAMRAIGERVVRLSGPFCFRLDVLGLGFPTPLKHLPAIYQSASQTSTTPWTSFQI